jgi:hypothetical protein
VATNKADESTVHWTRVRAHRQGWSSHELAHFHRVFDALWEAGLSLETDSGVTDEGEPWFVFCDVTSGEVVVHFARISGQCAVYASFLNGALTGRVFPDLVERFLDRCPGRRATSLSNHSPPAA